MSVSSASLMNLELPSKPVQELIRTNAKQVPQKYIYQNKSIDDFSEIEYMQTSTIDFNLLSSSSSNEQQQQQQQLQKLQSVVSSWGCFQLINHGLSTSLLDRIGEVGKQFFALPLDVKERHKRTIDSFQGYGGDTVSDAQNYNWNDRLHLKVHPLQHRNFMFWPEYLPNFREIVEEYITEVKKMVEMLLKSIAKLLNLEENKILNISGGNEGVNMYTRFNYYPPCSSADQVLGLKPHSDGTLLTVLLQDKQVEGLQVLKDNKWFKVPIVPHALFINLGDQLEIMSNGILKSAIHKVVIDKERSRTSIATLISPDPDKEIGPFTELIDDKERPRQYKNIKNYADLFFHDNIKTSRIMLICSSNTIQRVKGPSML